MNSTKVESPGNHEHFFIFGSPPLDTTPSYNFCRDTRTSSSCFEQHRNVSRLVEAGTHFHQNAARPSMTLSNKCFGTAANGDRCDEMSSCGTNNSSASESHLLKEMFLRRETNQPKLPKDDFLLDDFNRMSLQVEMDDCERETLALIHSTLRTASRFDVTCLFCERSSPVFDGFPVVDGTLFTSPVQLSSRAVPIRQQLTNGLQKDATPSKFMEFICVGCLTGKSNLIRCIACDRRWSGDCFQLGTLYSYNILSAMPCCSRHVDCKRCRKPIIEPSSDAFFSFYSNKITCPHCQEEDFHFVKSPVLFGK